MLCKAGPNGIQVYVAHQLKEVFVGIDQDRLVALGEDGTYSAVTAILPAGVPNMHRLHEPGEGLLPGMYNEVHVVRHDAPGQHPGVGILEPGAQQFDVASPLGLAVEQVATVDSP
jgi:hypothetical protein